MRETIFFLFVLAVVQLTGCTGVRRIPKSYGKPVAQDVPIQLTPVDLGVLVSGLASMDVYKQALQMSIEDAIVVMNPKYDNSNYVFNTVSPEIGIWSEKTPGGWNKYGSGKELARKGEVKNRNDTLRFSNLTLPMIRFESELNLENAWLTFTLFDENKYYCYGQSENRRQDFGFSEDTTVFKKAVYDEANFNEFVWRHLYKSRQFFLPSLD
ncbi:MAG: hypothetical protein AAGA66_17020, partial [Bacteroidota bacterium]